MLTPTMFETSMESVAFMKNKDFFNALVIEVSKLRKVLDSELPRRLPTTGIYPIDYFSKTIKKYTNLKIRPGFAPLVFGYNMAIQPPQVDKNHPLYSDQFKKAVKLEDIKRLLAKNGGPVEGGIDIRTGRVFGAWAEIECDLYFGVPLLKESTVTDKSIASLILHELGHCISYFYVLGNVLTLSHVIAELTSKWNGTESEIHRVEIARIVKNQMDIDAIDPTAMATLKDGDMVSTIVVSEYANKKSSYTNTPMLDYRTWEAMSDQYVVRNNAGYDLAVALDQLERLRGHPAYWSDGQYLLLNIFSIPFLVLTLPSVVLMMMFFKPYTEYDPPKERLQRIRNDMVNAIKNTNMPVDMARTYQNDIEEVDKLIASVNNREPWLDYIWKRIIPSIRKEEKRAKALKDFELLASNDLFLASNSFKTL